MTNNLKTGTQDTMSLSEDAGWIWMLLAMQAGRQLPALFSKVLDIPDRIMGQGYDLHIKVGDFELKFGRGLFQAQNEDL